MATYFNNAASRAARSLTGRGAPSRALALGLGRGGNEVYARFGLGMAEFGTGAMIAVALNQYAWDYLNSQADLDAQRGNLPGAYSPGFVGDGAVAVKPGWRSNGKSWEAFCRLSTSASDPAYTPLSFTTTANDSRAWQGVGSISGVYTSYWGIQRHEVFGGGSLARDYWDMTLPPLGVPAQVAPPSPIVSVPFRTRPTYGNRGRSIYHQSAVIIDDDMFHVPPAYAEGPVFVNTVGNAASVSANADPVHNAPPNTDHKLRDYVQVTKLLQVVGRGADVGRVLHMLYNASRSARHQRTITLGTRPSDYSRGRQMRGLGHSFTEGGRAPRDARHQTLRTLSWSKASWKTRFDVIEMGLTDGLDWEKFGKSFATWLVMKLAIAQIPSARVGSMSSDAYLFNVQNGTQ